MTSTAAVRASEVPMTTAPDVAATAPDNTHEIPRRPVE